MTFTINAPEGQFFSKCSQCGNPCIHDEKSKSKDDRCLYCIINDPDDINPKEDGTIWICPNGKYLRENGEWVKKKDDEIDI